MSKETADVIIEQTKMMTLDLTITVQKMRIKELDARRDMLGARSQLERYKLSKMIEEFKGLDDVDEAGVS